MLEDLIGSFFWNMIPCGHVEGMHTADGVGVTDWARKMLRLRILS